MHPPFWFGRSFDLDIDNRLFPNIVERLAGVPARLEEKIRRIPPANYTALVAEKWTIQEQVGHLLDLEPLWFGRVGDIRTGVETMREADLENRKTHEANHNEANMAELLAAFRGEREKLIAVLRKLDAGDLEKTALHPRLQQPMRIIGLAYFTAEHDDHHLALIEWINAKLISS